MVRAGLSRDLSGDELQREILDTLRDIRKILQKAAQQPNDAARPPEAKR